MTHTTLPRLADALATEVANWHTYLRHTDPAARIEGLLAIRDYVDALIIHEEHRITQPQVNTAAGECGGALRRLMTHLKNFPRERSLP